MKYIYIYIYIYELYLVIVEDLAKLRECYPRCRLLHRGSFSYMGNLCEFEGALLGTNDCGLHIYICIQLLCEGAR